MPGANTHNSNVIINQREALMAQPNNHNQKDEEFRSEQERKQERDVNPRDRENKRSDQYVDPTRKDQRSTDSRRQATGRNH